MVDWNSALRDRVWQKLRQLDGKNNGDKLATMRDFCEWAQKPYDKGAHVVNYGEYIEASLCKPITKNGIKGMGHCRVYFYSNGDVMELKY